MGYVLEPECFAAAKILRCNASSITMYIMESTPVERASCHLIDFVIFWWFGGDEIVVK